MTLTITNLTLAIMGVCLFPAAVALIYGYDYRKHWYKVPLAPYYAAYYAAYYAVLGIVWYVKGFWTTKGKYDSSKLATLPFLILFAISCSSYLILLNLCYNDSMDLVKAFENHMPLWAVVTNAFAAGFVVVASILVVLMPFINVDDPNER